MEININDIESGQDSTISILTYIRKNIDLNITIDQINSGQDTDIVINNYFQNSPSYKKLLAKIEAQKELLHSLNQSSGRYQLETKKLADLEQSTQDFKVNALRLADTFLLISSDSERIRKAKAYFEQGLIEEADKMLVETEMLEDQESLIAQMDYIMNRIEFLKNNSPKNE